MKFSDKLSLIIATTGITVLLLFSYVTYRVNDNALMKAQFLYSQSIATEIAKDTSIGRFKLIRSGCMVVFEEGSEPPEYMDC